MHRRPARLFGSRAAALLSAVGALVSCSREAPDVVGRWRNGTAQLLVIEPDLSGVVYQEAACAPPLRLRVRRDPFDAYALRFEDNQSVYFPLAQRELFAPAEYFCASKDSVPMCQFCRLEGDTLACSRTEQKITGRGVLVTHDCAWTRVLAGTGTSTTPADAGVRCPGAFDAGAGCRPGVGEGSDAGAQAPQDAGAAPDAGAGD